MSNPDDYHVMPVGDLLEHTNNDRHCDCDPRIDVQPGGAAVVVHNAWDNREFDEIANEINNS